MPLYGYNYGDSINGQRNPVAMVSSGVDASRSGGTTANESFGGMMPGFENLESTANTNSGYGGLYSNPNLGMVPQATMDSYYDQAGAADEKASRGAYASMFGESGAAPDRQGAQVEMLSRRATERNLQRAKGNVENAATGAKTQANAQMGIAGNRYNSYMKLLMDYYANQLKQSNASLTGGVSGGSPYAKMKGQQDSSDFWNQKPWWEQSNQTSEPDSNYNGNTQPNIEEAYYNRANRPVQGFNTMYNW
jgi:hypothetical protein